jgi:hypothetical protein
MPPSHRRAGQRVDEGGAALAERSPGVVVIAEGEQVEDDEGRRRPVVMMISPSITQCSGSCGLTAATCSWK